MTVVVDASVVVAAVSDTRATGEWARGLLASERLAAPHLMPVEVTAMLRRAALTRAISVDLASLALGDALDLRVELFAFEPFAARVWELRANITAYDAWYVALAEFLAAPLATVDDRLSRAKGLYCGFATPGKPSGSR